MPARIPSRTTQSQCWKQTMGMFNNKEQVRSAHSLFFFLSAPRWGKGRPGRHSFCLHCDFKLIIQQLSLNLNTPHPFPLWHCLKHSTSGFSGECCPSQMGVGWGGGGGGGGWGAGIGDKIHFTHSLLGQNCWKEWSFQLYSTAVLAQQHWNILYWQLLSVLWFLMSSVVGWHVRDTGSVLAVEFIHTTTLCCQSRPRFGCTWLPIRWFDEKQWQQTKMSELKKVFTGLCRSYSSQGCPDSLICPNPPPTPPPLFFVVVFVCLFVFVLIGMYACLA